MSSLKPIRTLILFITAAMVGSVAVFGQATKPTPPPIEDDEVIRVDSRLIIVPVSVTDTGGNPVTGLTVGDFKLIEENRPQKIDSVLSSEQVPLEIALLFDISASTDSMFRFQQETAARFLRQVLRPDDRATVFTVGQNPMIVQERDTAERSVESLRSIVPTKEQTAFYDTVRKAAEYLQEHAPQGRRKVILIISDGEDTSSDGVTRAIWNAERKIASSVTQTKLREIRVKARDMAKAAEQKKVLRALQDADVVLYAINPAGSSFQLNRISQFGQENMQKFADETGGTAFLPHFLPIDTPDQYQNANNIRRNTSMLERIFRQLASELRAQYLVQYYSESEFPEGKFVRVDLSLKNRGDLRVRSRQGYFVKN